MEFDVGLWGVLISFLVCGVYAILWKVDDLLEMVAAANGNGGRNSGSGCTGGDDYLWDENSQSIVFPPLVIN